MYHCLVIHSMLQIQKIGSKETLFRFQRPSVWSVFQCITYFVLHILPEYTRVVLNVNQQEYFKTSCISTPKVRPN